MKMLLLTATLSLAGVSLAFAAGEKMPNSTAQSTTINSSKSMSNSHLTDDQEKWWHDKDVNNDGKVTREEYVQSEMRHGKTQTQAQAQFDKKDKDKKGYFERSEIGAWFEKIGDKVDKMVQ